MTRVFYLSEIPTPYRLPLLSRLAERPELDLHVGFLSSQHPDRPWDTDAELQNVRHEFLPGVAIGIPLRRETSYVQLNLGLGRRLREIDVLVVAGYSTPGEQIAILQARALGVPYLIHSESHDLSPRIGAKRALKRAVLPSLIGTAAGGLATGSAAARYLVRYGLHPGRIRIFPNTIDVGRYRREAEAARADAAAVRATMGLPERFWLYAGRLVESKGIADLIEARRQLADEALPLVVAGRGPLARSIEGEPGVYMLGFLQSSELVAVFALAERTIVPSLEEPWGVIVNEALAAGSPVVASSAVGAAEDLIVPGGNGAVYAAGDVDALSTALIAPLPRSDAHRGRIAHWDYDFAIDQFLEAVELAHTAQRAR